MIPGTGVGTFGALITSLPQQEVSATTTGDLNGDGRLDLAGAANSSIRVLFGTEGGLVRGSDLRVMGSSTDAPALGDMNGDGKLDVVTTNVINNQVSLLFGNGDGTFR
jgi:FG-GAP-like repeat